MIVGAQSSVDIHKTDLFVKIVTLTIVLSVFLRYKTPGVPFLLLCDTLFIAYIAIILVVNRERSTLAKCSYPMYVFTIYMIIVTLIASGTLDNFDYSTSFTTILKFITYVVLISLVAIKYFDIDYGAKVYTYASLINSLIVISQSILFRVTGIKTSLLAPFLKAESSYSNELIQGLINYRPTGLLFEASHGAHYCIPALLLILFYKSNSYTPSSFRRLVYVSIISIALILSESGAATVLLTAVLLVYVLYFIKKANWTNARVYFVIIALITIFAVVWNSEVFQVGLLRGTALTSGSGSTRVIRGLLAYSEFPLIHKTFGVGYGNYEYYLISAGITTIYDYVQSISYTNTAVYILSGTGLIGFLLYFGIYYSAFIRSHGVFKLFILFLFTSVFYGGIALTTSFIIIFCFVYNSYYTIPLKKGSTSGSLCKNETNHERKVEAPKA